MYPPYNIFPHALLNTSKHSKGLFSEGSLLALGKLVPSDIAMRLSPRTSASEHSQKNVSNQYANGLVKARTTSGPKNAKQFCRHLKTLRLM